MADIDAIRKEFNRIKSLGPIESIAENKYSTRSDGAAGETFQFHLGRVARDNKKEADWEGWEVKSKRNTSTSATTLYSQKPTYPPRGDRYMLEKWGIPDEMFQQKLKLNTSLYATRFSKVHLRTKSVPTYLMKIENNKVENKISLIVCDEDKNIIDDSVYWSYEDIAVGFTKLHNTFLVEPVVKIIDGKEYFHYKSATVLLESSLESFLDCIDDGVIRYDHRWSVDHRGPHAGKEHNHGGGFRLINKGDWMKLASSKINLD